MFLIKTNNAHQSGFTLMEVIVAISIFALLGAGSYRVVSGLALSQYILEEKSESTRNLAKAMRIIERDFEQLAQRAIYDEYGLREAAVITEGEYLVEFTRHGVRNPLLKKRSELQRVAYGLVDTLEDDDEQGGNQGELEGQYLVRYLWPVLDRGYKTEPVMQVLLSGIATLSIEYLDGTQKNQEWFSDWPTATQQSNKGLTDLPKAIRLKIDLAVHGEIERLMQISDLSQ